MWRWTDEASSFVHKIWKRRQTEQVYSSEVGIFLIQMSWDEPILAIPCPLHNWLLPNGSALKPHIDIVCVGTDGSKRFLGPFHWYSTYETTRKKGSCLPY